MCHWCSDLSWRAFSRWTQITGSAPALGTSRIALDQMFYAFQNVPQSLCYGGHEAPVVSVSLGVVAAICLLPARFSQIQYKTPFSICSQCSQKVVTTRSSREGICIAMIPSRPVLNSKSYCWRCSSHRAIRDKRKTASEGLCDLSEIPLLGSAGTTENVAAFKLSSTLGSLLALSASLWIFSLFSSCSQCLQEV